MDRILEAGRLYRVPLEADHGLRNAWGTLSSPAPPGGGELYHLFATDRVILRHARYLPGTRVERHSHAVAAFSYGDGGPCYEDSPHFRGSKKRLTFHPAGYEHELVYAGATDVLAIEIVGDMGRLPADPVTLPATGYLHVWSMLIAVAHGEQSIVDAAAARLCELAKEQPERREPEWLTAVRDEIHKCWERTPSAASLAGRVGISVSHLCREFRRHTGVTMREYSVLLRLDRARHLLWSTDLRLADIAAETGFADQSHLSHALALHSRFLPGELRKLRPTRLSPRAGSINPIQYIDNSGR